MKKKAVLLIVMLAGLIFSLNAQQVEEIVKAEVRQREAEARLRETGVRANDPRVVIGNTGIDSKGWVTIGGEEEKRISLSLSKFFEGETINSTADFDVSEGHTSISLNLSGSCSSGDITITIVQPDGEIMKNQKITAAADVSWSARFPIKEGEEKKYVGKWKLEIKTNNAKGRYNLNISGR